ncbi:DUF3482 domain-containing protein [Aliidiomarina minuta]|uniref:DUF3482 domain-containing protein n=1 Tax=Aliidiomarina minuta TaxID=880057 RepID=A0A432W578_9GAMM|nr:GTPase/DUF3482 domain-containing protein [Aliidiomarina minuta]RUO25225.1 DUF3482 domain-containing protein [Aliidiomarina minuta]
MQPHEALTIAVVGHTNVGKTSLLRTLLHDTEFGQVASNPSTTQDVSSASLKLASGEQLKLFDTPGLEDGIGLYDYLQQLQNENTRHDGPQQMQRFLDSPEAKQSFEQEAKVIRQLLKSHAAFYVIDVRDPVLPKFQDELSIMTRCGRPLLPVLNFTASAENHSHAWQQALANVNLHAWVEFDSIAPPEGGEEQIFRQLQALLPGQQALLQAFIAEHKDTQARQQQQANMLIAELLMDCAAYRRRVASTDKSDMQSAITAMQDDTRKREHACVQGLLRLFHFRPDDATFDQLAVRQGRWQDDLFHPQTLRRFGIKASKGTAAGAAAGAGIDLLFVGTTLGAGTALGAAAGGLWQTWKGYGQRLQDKFRGFHLLSVDDRILHLLAQRQKQLVQLLRQRGHAAIQTLQIQVPESQEKQQKQLSAELEQARAHPEWSALNQQIFEDSMERQLQLKSLSQKLVQQFSIDKSTE